MLIKNSELRTQARLALEGKWGSAAWVTFVFMLIQIPITYIDEILNLIYVLNTPENISAFFALQFLKFGLVIFILLPLGWGFQVLFLDTFIGVDTFRGGDFKVRKIFKGFDDYGRILGTTLLMSIYLFLWMLLLIVPGIIKNFSYAMTYYILKDHPELSGNQAIEKSMRMMKGHKMKFFLLQLSFIGWFLLAILSLGIGLFWLIPYVNSSNAAFYENLKKQEAVG